jgi:hypothetical protein
MKKILVIVDSGSNGLGNGIMSLCIFNVLNKNKIEFDICIEQKRIFELFSLLFPNKVIFSNNVDIKKYDGQIITLGNTSKFSLPILHKLNFSHQQRMTHSEVSLNILQITGNVKGIPEYVYNCRHFFEHLLEPEKYESFDCVIANGCNTNKQIPELWSIKKYPFFKEFIQYKHSIDQQCAMVGSKSEMVEGCIQKADTSFIETINLVNNAKEIVANDTFIAHLSCALQKPTKIIYTATSPEKNFDKNFHKTGKVIRRNDLSCIGCQSRGNGYWLNNCKNSYSCQNIDKKLLYINHIVNNVS